MGAALDIHTMVKLPDAHGGEKFAFVWLDDVSMTSASLLNDVDRCHLDH
jgi:hypothetical protein